MADGQVMPTETRARVAWLDRYIRAGIDNGTIRRMDGRRALRELANIRKTDTYYRDRYGRISVRNETALQLRLNRLSQQLGVSTRQDSSAY